MQKKSILVLVFLIVCLSISCQTLNLDVCVPKETAQGEFITVYFTANKPIEKPSVLMMSPDNKEVQKIDAFNIDDTKKNWVAVIGIAKWYRAGDWTVSTVASHKEVLDKQSYSLKVSPTEFEEYTIYLDARNAGIIRNTSAEKKEQTKRLNELLTKIDADAQRFSGKFIRPLVSERITSTFGEKRTSKYPDGKTSGWTHWGIDFGTPIGTKVRAVGDGKIVMAENRITTGGTLIIEHAPGVYSLYYHLSETLAKVGDIVKSGDIVALTGNSGISTGPHLHWEMRINTIPVSPNFISSKKLF